MEDKIEEIVTWLQRQVKQAKVKGLLVGLSGGLDSAVVANLIKRACPDDSLAVIMPIQSSPGDMVDADKTIEACGISRMHVDLTPSHKLLYGTIKMELQNEQTWNENQDRIADANLRARLRMSTLYTIATNHQYLVVGTDNAAEWYTGYFTKHGDGAVDIQPIIDLTKQEVKEMASYLEVPQSVIDKQPSADLWVGQTDEEEMGTTYEYIDAHLLGQEVPAEDKQIIENLHQRTAHKRQIATQMRLK